MTNSATDLDTIYPISKTLNVGDVVITFNELVIKKISPFALAIKPILNDQQLDDLFALSINGDEMQAAIAIEDMAIKHADAIAEALSCCSDVDQAWLSNQDIGVLISLAQKAVEVNKSYFLRRLVPRILQAMQTQPAGDMQSAS